MRDALRRFFGFPVAPPKVIYTETQIALYEQQLVAAARLHGPPPTESPPIVVVPRVTISEFRREEVVTVDPAKEMERLAEATRQFMAMRWSNSRGV
jgi:hypothetical protein